MTQMTKMTVMEGAGFTENYPLPTASRAFLNTLLSTLLIILFLLPQATATQNITATIIHPAERLINIHIQEQEHENYCGQAAIQAVLAYNGINKTQRQIALEMGQLGRTYPGDIALYIKKQGLTAHWINDIHAYNGTAPAIVYVNGGTHWALYKGKYFYEGEWVPAYSEPGRKTVIYEKAENGYPRFYRALIIYGGTTE